MEFDYYWRLRCRLPERNGQRCRVLIRSRVANYKVAGLYLLTPSFVSEKSLTAMVSVANEQRVYIPLSLISTVM